MEQNNVPKGVFQKGGRRYDDVTFWQGHFRLAATNFNVFDMLNSEVMYFDKMSI